MSILNPGSRIPNLDHGSSLGSQLDNYMVKSEFCLEFQSCDMHCLKPNTHLAPFPQAIELEVDRIRCFIKLLHMAAARPQIMDDLRQCTAANMAECADAVSDIRNSKVSLACPCATPYLGHLNPKSSNTTQIPLAKKWVRLMCNPCFLRNFTLDSSPVNISIRASCWWPLSMQRAASATCLQHPKLRSRAAAAHSSAKSDVQPRIHCFGS